MKRLASIYRQLIQWPSCRVSSLLLLLLFSIACQRDPIVFTADIAPVIDPNEALPGVFMPPFVHCQAPLDGIPGNSEAGQVCTPVAISGSTEEGRKFQDYANCAVVRTQRPYWPAPNAAIPDPNDPRLLNPAYVNEMEWAREQAAASGCTCCHDSSEAPLGSSQWEINVAGNWITTASDAAIALFAGYADSTQLGAYPPHLANGFDRETVGIPTTDIPRMKAFMDAELAYRGITIEEAQQIPAFGGPLVDFANSPPTTCEPGRGILSNGSVIWTGGPARYVYLLEVGSANPGVPPNLDLPEGTLWRLDVPPSQTGMLSGVKYGETPVGTSQTYPTTGRAPRLETGRQYHLSVLFDVGVPLTNCIFTAGEVEIGTIEPTTEFGAFCVEDANCESPVDTCFRPPGQTSGYCSASGCDIDPSICPENWSCLDLSIFNPSLPHICQRPY